MSNSRPEGSKPPEVYYDESESRKIITIQAEISSRAIEMLALPAGKPCLILDIGCGSGLSGRALEEAGHYWVGCDISQSMLEVASERENEKGDLIHHDMGLGLPFRPASFDGVISISAIQWLCYANSSDQDPRLRLNRFFSSLYSVLKKDARAVLQFYPESSEQAVLIAQSASRCGFAGGLVVDYPNSAKAKKYYLVLSFERSFQLPRAMGVGEEGAGNNVLAVGRERRNGNKGKGADGQRLSVKSHDWVVRKKTRMRAQGKEVKTDSKYTARKRPTAF